MLTFRPNVGKGGKDALKAMRPVSGLSEKRGRTSNIEEGARES